MEQVTLNTVTAHRREPFARALWRRIETIHAATYFAPESTEATADAGVRGFWRTYFGFRAAPMGPCPPATVTACFFGFAPSMVERAVPAIWTLLGPERFVELRSVSAAAALRRVAPAVERLAGSEEVQRILVPASIEAPVAGRPLYAANRAIAHRDDPVEALWQACTTLREHRGDGHVAALTAAGLTAPQALWLFAAESALPDALFQDNRGWTDDQWSGAHAELTELGLLDGHGATEVGRNVRAEVEEVTDKAAASPFDGLDDESRNDLLDALTPVAEDIAKSGIIPYPNPMGLARLDGRSAGARASEDA